MVWISAIVGVIVLIIEFVLGKTNYVKPNSILEYILEALVEFAKKIEEKLTSNEEEKEG